MSTVEHNRQANGLGPFEFVLGDELRGERATLGKTLLDVQRELRIKAAYIDAIENCRPQDFPNPSFVHGYVRSYARYLGLDPDIVWRRFCADSGFSPGRPSPAPYRTVPGAAAARGASGGFRPDFPIARLQPSGLADIPFSAIGSLLVLLALVAGLGYGGWSLLQNIQRVQFAPVDDLPLAVAEIGPLPAPAAPDAGAPTLDELASPVAATALSELYRQQELEVPILVPRDGPIAALDPDKVGPLAGRAVAVVRPEPAVASGPEVVTLPAAAKTTGAEPEPAAAAAPPLTVLAERAAWIRVYLESGTILFEAILEKGDAYSPPDGVGAPLIWAGNSGSVYVRVGDALYGPLGQGTRAARDIPLDPRSIAESYALVTDVPEVVSQAVEAPPAVPGDGIAIR